MFNPYDFWFPEVKVHADKYFFKMIEDSEYVFLFEFRNMVPLMITRFDGLEYFKRGYSPGYLMKLYKKGPFIFEV